MHSNCSSPLLLNILSEIALKSSELFGLYGEQLRDTLCNRSAPLFKSIIFLVFSKLLIEICILFQIFSFVWERFLLVNMLIQKPVDLCLRIKFELRTQKLFSFMITLASSFSLKVNYENSTFFQLLLKIAKRFSVFKVQPT